VTLSPGSNPSQQELRIQMTQADRVLSTPPLSTSVPERPPRLPTPQERADELLMLARAAGIPADRRLDTEDQR
jgi:hypothetical protein